MQQFLHLHVSYLCRTGRTNKKGQSPIVIRIIYRHERRDVYTGLYCPGSDWDSENGKMFPVSKRADSINKNLDLIRHKAITAFDELKYTGTVFTMDELVNKIKGEEEKPLLIIEYLQQRNNELKQKAGFEFTQATYEKYDRVIRYMTSYLESKHKVKNYPLAKIDKVFLEGFYTYLRAVKLIGNNTAVKYMAFFKTAIMPAIHQGIIRPDPYKQTRFRTKTVHKGFLTREEIENLEKVKLQGPDLHRIRNQFLFCCYTGLAYSDLKQLRRDHFIPQPQNEYYILKPRQKTGQQSIIPLLPKARKILQLYSLTLDFRDFAWHVSANQKMNQRLKTIGEEAGISKTIHMHLARHTFATTVTLSNGVPIESVSSMLGHATIRQTQHYAKIVAQKVLNDMARIKKFYQ